MSRIHPSCSDVIVLGGGPAGVAAALTLSRHGYRVRLIDWPRRRTGWMCETLAPKTAALIAQLTQPGFLESLSRVQSPGIVSTWDDQSSVEVEYIFSPFGMGNHVNRDELHAALINDVRKAGVDVTVAKLRSCRRLSHDGWTICADDGQTVVEYAAHWIIDATGRASWFAARQHVSFIETDQLVALVGESRVENSGDPRLHIRATPDGWCYRVPLPDGTSLLAFLTDCDQLPVGRQAQWAFWNSQLPENWRAEWCETPAEPGSRIRCIPSASRWATKVTGPNWIIAGDAAVSADPLCGRGIELALASGNEAAWVIESVDRGDDSLLAEYESAMLDRRSRLWTEQSQLYATVGSWVDRPFWKRRRQATLPHSLLRN